MPTHIGPYFSHFFLQAETGQRLMFNFILDQNKNTWIAAGLQVSVLTSKLTNQEACINNVIENNHPYSILNYVTRTLRSCLDQNLNNLV